MSYLGDYELKRNKITGDSTERKEVNVWYGITVTVMMNKARISCTSHLHFHNFCLFVLFGSSSFYHIHWYLCMKRVQLRWYNEFDHRMLFQFY